MSTRRRLFEEAAALIVRNAERYTSKATTRCCRARWPRRQPSRMPCRSTSPWAARPIPCCTCWPWPTRRAWTSRCTTSTAFRAGYPCCARSHPNSHYHIQDVNRAGGILSILGELARADCSTPRPGGSTAARWARRSRPATCGAKRWATTPSAAGEAPPPARATGSWAHRTPATTHSTPTARRAASATRSTPISATEGWPY